MSWILIIAAVAFLYLIFMFKADNFKTKITYVFVFLGVAFILISAYFVYVGNQLSLTTFDGVLDSVRSYANWLVLAGKNVVRTTGYMINQDWSFNATNITK